MFNFGGVSPAGDRRLLGTSTCHGCHGQIPRAMNFIEKKLVQLHMILEGTSPSLGKASLFRVAHPFFFVFLLFGAKSPLWACERDVRMTVDVCQMIFMDFYYFSHCMHRGLKTPTEVGRISSLRFHKFGPISMNDARSWQNRNL